jgi:hypothetical protein
MVSPTITYGTSILLAGLMVYGLLSKFQSKKVIT